MDSRVLGLVLPTATSPEADDPNLAWLGSDRLPAREDRHGDISVEIIVSPPTVLANSDRKT